MEKGFSKGELIHILIAILVFGFVIGFRYIIEEKWILLPVSLIFAALILGLNILAKKLTARALDSDVEHSIWTMRQYGIKPRWKFRYEMPMGIILPLLFTFFFLGTVYITTILSYEARALKRRVAKRFGYYSYSELTDFHNGLIGASGILIVLLLAFIAYFLPFANAELLSKMAVFYAFWNMVPFSKLDGTQIFFGSKVVYAVLAIITLIFTLNFLLIV